MTKILIVESPTKANTIKRYLGDDYKVLSSKGHIRDLPEKELGVDLTNDFEPHYEVQPDSRDVVKQLRKEIQDGEVVFLGPDPDREGEAIAWHLSKLLDGDGPPIRRVEFNEVTSDAVRRALEDPREIDMSLVDAQQARRILDRLVGYQISPVMWRKVRRGMSAGRVQSVAVKFVCEREEEIREFEPEEYWTIEADFKPDSGEAFTAKLHKVDGEDPELPDEETVNELTEPLEDEDFTVTTVETKTRNRYPKPPFTTSTLQQQANRRLNFSSKRTMQVAQQLYEGVSLGDTTEGIITYMRTDSVRVGKDAIFKARGTVEGMFGEEYLPEKPNFYTDSDDNVQGAHEAIRPTVPGRTPDAIKKYLSKSQYRLYDLIWKRFIASQMSPAKVERGTIEVEDGPTLWRTTASRVIFDGFLKVTGYNRDKDETLPEGIDSGDSVSMVELRPEQHFTRPPPRYNDASLVKELEENGIGRPSTYAQIIDKIIARDYVERRKKTLHPTELGFAANEFMHKFFPDIVDVDFTAEMEEDLDEIESGELNWKVLLHQFYDDFREEVEQAESSDEYIDVKPLPAPEGTECPECGGEMVYRRGKYGRFLGCADYPDCTGTLQVDSQGNPIENDNQDRDTILIGEDCPECGGDLVLRFNRYGSEFIGCNSYPDCDYTRDAQTSCPKCGGEIDSRQLKNRRKIRFCTEDDCEFSVWGRPMWERCDECGWWLAERTQSGDKFRFCSNQDCVNNDGIDDAYLQEIRELMLEETAAEKAE